MLNKIKSWPIHTLFNICLVMIVVGMIITLISYQFGQNTSLNFWTLVGLALMLGGMLWHILFVRCPHCGNHFNLRRSIPKYCPNCGKYVDKFH